VSFTFSGLRGFKECEILGLLLLDLCCLAFGGVLGEVVGVAAVGYAEEETLLFGERERGCGVADCGVVFV
jgi:hypothetical protein